ncbi:hypothetical protein AQUCO_00400743v1 [Aquilegia coerulea]|uniref:NB-ARC domain-containing protein n=1 Tax=Aquilegia coerulea TaxID=218851 RepID=A0A2G5EWH8_AQUCA|nr:hypothetical protein AQUCO_00400743v1 [Aquilegia coerulea]
MVYWFLSSFVSASLQVLIEKLANLGISVYESVSNVEDKLKKLERTLFKVQALIQYAEDKQISQLAWQVWLRDLEQVAYDADDLIDEVVIKVSKLESENHNYKEQTSSLVDEVHVFGRESDKGELIRILLAPEESCIGKDVPVVTIVGMVGIGKTTLAQIVYNYSYHKIEGSFQLKMWVSVTKAFNVARVTKSIIEAATGKTHDALDLDPLQVQLRQILQGKKFLLVLDDVWTENRKEWDLLLKPLRHGLQGSKIIVTTRSQVVSSMVTTTGSYRLKCLSDQDCWSLLRHEALGNINLNVCPKLEAIGIEIAKICRGLPLAAKCLGRSLLHSKIDEDDWILLQKCKIWDLPEVKNEMLPALRLSYHHLPSHLKQCFAYCSVFYPSHEFEKEKLVQMWIGEGFIQPEVGKRMEDTGSYYFDQLLWASFFQREGEKYKMHDAVLHMARLISGDKFYKMEEDSDLHTSRLSKSTRHSSILCEYIDTVDFKAFYKCKGLHTFLVSCKYGTSFKEVPPALFQKLGLLRVLDLSQSQIEELSESISNLKHLRFLDLSKTLLTSLPETTHELCSLQTLRLKSCSRLLCLPKGTEMLTSLKHLELERSSQLTSMPAGIGKLTGLQTLSEFITGCKSGQIAELKDMNNIRGSLCIKQLEMVNSPEEAEEAKLVNKIYLERLDLQWRSTVDIRHEEHVLNNLKPHETLKELTLRKYGGETFPSWVSNPSFSKLTNICLYDCKNCILLPYLGILPKLKCLRIAEMHKLTAVDSIFSSNGVNMGFPLLETLEIRDMPKLMSWSGLRENDMQCLIELTIVECPEMAVLPSLHYFTSLEKLEIENCPKIPSVTNERLSSSIQSLIITNCPKLKETCGAEGCADWEKIHHIPNKTIDFESV